jgi:hypothetical protein
VASSALAANPRGSKKPTGCKSAGESVEDKCPIRQKKITAMRVVNVLFDSAVFHRAAEYSEKKINIQGKHVPTTMERLPTEDGCNTQMQSCIYFVNARNKKRVPLPW